MVLLLALAHATPVLTTSSHAEWIDVDRDGWDDLVIEYGHAVRYNLQGELSPVFPLVPDRFSYAAVADLDGDGFPELLFHDGEFLYSAPGQGRAYGLPLIVSTTVGHGLGIDYDRDGDEDLLLGHQGSLLLLRNEAGEELVPEEIGPYEPVHWLKVDLDDDGMTDLVGSGGYSAVIFRGTTGAGYESPISWRIPPGSQVAFGDFDGDGKTDRAHRSTGDIQLERRLVELNYQPVGAQKCGAKFGVADIDRDGTFDIVCSGQQTTWTTAASGINVNAASTGSSALLLHDINNDGWTDLTRLKSRPVVAYGPLREPSATTRFAPRPDSETMVLAMDVNQDGIQDLIYRSYDDQLTWLQGLPPGGFSLGGVIATDDVWNPLEVIDLNHDGTLDLLAEDGRDLHVFYGGPDGTLLPGQLWRESAQECVALDFDGDGTLELGFVQHGTELWIHDPSTDESSQWVTSSDAFHSLAVADIDQDGASELTALRDERTTSTVVAVGSSGAIWELPAGLDGKELAWFDAKGTGYPNAFVAGQVCIPQGRATICGGSVLSVFENLGGVLPIDQPPIIPNVNPPLLHATFADGSKRLIVQTEDNTLHSLANEELTFLSTLPPSHDLIATPDLDGDGATDFVTRSGDSIHVRFAQDRFGMLAPALPEPAIEAEEGPVDEPVSDDEKARGCGCSSRATATHDWLRVFARR